MKGFEPRAIYLACERAWRVHPSWFPALGDLYSLVEHYAKTLETTPHQLPAEKPYQDAEATEKVRRIVAELASKKDVEDVWAAEKKAIEAAKKDQEGA